MKFTRFEQETVINFNAEEEMASLYTRDSAVMRRMDTLVNRFLEVYRCTKATDIDKTYEMPKSYVSYRKPRKLSEEQREAARARARSLRKEEKSYHVPAYDEVHYINNMWKAFFYMSVATGMRRGELLALKWTDIDFENNKVSITKAVTLTKQDGPIIKESKTISGRRVLSLPEVCIPYLVDWYAEERDYYFAHKDIWAQEDIEDYEDNFLFIQKDSRVMHPTTPSNKFREILIRHNERADEEHQLPLINLHTLRHSAASILIESGVIC